MQQAGSSFPATGTANPSPAVTPKTPSFAERLEGMKLGNWFVDKRLERPSDPDVTGGYFSVGYLVTHSDNGTEAFLKAFDLERILTESGGQLNQMQALMTMTAGFQFERDVLHSAKRMDRVVQVHVGYGEPRLPCRLESIYVVTD